MAMWSGMTEIGMKRLALMLVVLSMVSSFFDFYTALLILSIAFVVYASAAMKGREVENTIVATVEKGMTLKLEKPLYYGFDVRPVFAPGMIKFLGYKDAGDRREFTFECLGDGECAVKFEYRKVKATPGDAQEVLKKFDQAVTLIPGVLGADISAEGSSYVLIVRVGKQYVSGSAPSKFFGVAVRVVEVSADV